MRILLILTILAIIAVPAFAVDYNVFIEPTEKTIYGNGTATFNIELRSNLPREQEFDVYTPDVSWLLGVEDEFFVPGGADFTTRVNITPFRLSPGLYTVPLIFHAKGGGRSVRKIVRINLVEEVPLSESYLPAVKGTVHMDADVDPREKVSLKVVLENQNKRPLDNVEIKVRSDTLNGDFTTSLTGLEKKVETFELSMDPKTSPRKDTLQVFAIVPDDEPYRFDFLPTPFVVKEYGDINELRNESAGFLSREIVFVLVNEGNSDNIHTIKAPVNMFSRFFVSASVPGELVGDNYVWEFELSPGESVQVSVKYNYWSAFWILVLIGLLVGGYFYFRSPILVKKTVKVVGKDEDSTNVKIVLELKNRGFSVLRKIKVMDLVPNMASVRIKHAAHMLEPSSISKKGDHGTLVRWDIDHMEPKEHRILSYNAKCKYAVVEGVSFPVTVVKFLSRGKDMQSVSNKAVVGE